MKKQCLFALSAVFLLAGAQVAHADTTVLGGRLFVQNTGEVFATYLTQQGAWFHDYAYATIGNQTQFLFQNWQPNSSTISLGVFAAGTEINLQLNSDVRTGAGGNDYFPTRTFYSGPAANNMDGIAHAKITYDYQGQANKALVGFEDFYYYPNYNQNLYNYSDLRLTMTNVGLANPVPEPSTYAMLALGMAGLFMLRRRQKRA